MTAEWWTGLALIVAIGLFAWRFTGEPPDQWGHLNQMRDAGWGDGPAPKDGLPRRRWFRRRP